MATAWYVQKNNRSVGPLTARQLRELVLAGKVRGDDLVRKGDSGEFVPASRNKKLFAPVNATSRPTPPPPRIPDTHKPHPPAPALPTGTKTSRTSSFPRQLGFIVSLAVVALVLAGGFFITWRNHSFDSSFNTVGDDASSMSSHDSGHAERNKHGTLPEEFRRHARNVELPIAEALGTIRQTNSDLNDVRLKFSPSSRLLFLLTLAMDREQQTLRLFRADTGLPVLPEKSEIDYFSFPAILSPDETQLACCDGEFLRIWKLDAASAILQQSIKLPEELEPPHGFRLSWKQDATLVVSARPSYSGTSRRIQVYRRAANGAFEKASKTLIFVRHQGPDGYPVDPSDAIVSADGKHVCVVSKSRQGHTVRIIDVGGGQTERTLSSSGPPAWNWGRREKEFPSLEINLRTENQRNGDPTSSLQLSPNGDYLLCGVADDSGVKAEVYRTSDWQKCDTLPVFTPLCFSHDGSAIAGYTASESRTSKGNQVARTAVVYDLGSAKQLMSVDMGKKFGESDPGYREPSLLAAFSADDSKLIVFYSKELKGWNKERNRAEVEWVLGAWDIKTGDSEFLTSRVADKKTIGEFSLSSTGKTLFNSLVAWDVPHLVELDKALAKADQLWDSGKQADVLPDYASVIIDSYQWFVEGDLDRAYCRSLDALALTDRIEDGRTLITAMENQGFDVSVETGKGKTLVTAFNEERAEAARRYAGEQRALETERLAEVRQANQAKYSPATTMTKREFVQKMNQTKSMGTITTHGVNVVYEDHSFQDVFGDPDSEVTSSGYRKLLHFRCADGMVQLRAVIVEGRTIVSEINYY